MTPTKSPFSETATLSDIADLSRRLWCVPEFGLIYVRNAKSGCSTIQEALWKAVQPDSYAGNPQDLVNSPSRAGFAAFRSQPARIAATTVFSAARNPYVRFVSAYVDKVLRRETRGRTWAGVASQYGFEHRSTPKADVLLERLAADDPDAVDAHFRPQHKNLLHPHVQPHFVGHLERMEEIESFLQERGVGMGKHAPHATGALERLFVILNSDKLIRAVQDLYKDDFRLYGYSEDPAVQTPITGPIVADSENSELAALLATNPVRSRAKATPILSDAR